MVDGGLYDILNFSYEVWLKNRCSADSFTKYLQSIFDILHLSVFVVKEGRNTQKLKQLVRNTTCI